MKTIELLNPWTIEVDKRGQSEVYLRIINSNTGEIRGIALSVDDIATIHDVEMLRIKAVRRLDEQDDDTDTVALMELLDKYE